MTEYSIPINKLEKMHPRSIKIGKTTLSGFKDTFQNSILGVEFNEIRDSYKVEINLIAIFYFFKIKSLDLMI